jgi:hypothetical protein
LVTSSFFSLITLAIRWHFVSLRSQNGTNRINVIGAQFGVLVKHDPATARNIRHPKEGSTPSFSAKKNRNASFGFFVLQHVASPACISDCKTKKQNAFQAF